MSSSPPVSSSPFAATQSPEFAQKVIAIRDEAVNNAIDKAKKFTETHTAEWEISAYAQLIAKKANREFKKNVVQRLSEPLISGIVEAVSESQVTYFYVELKEKLIKIMSDIVKVNNPLPSTIPIPKPPDNPPLSPGNGIKV